MASFTIRISSKFEQFWRYNMIVMCDVIRADETHEIIKHESEIAPVGAELREPPIGYSANRDVVLKSSSATSATLYIYIIPHTLPATINVDDAPPFELVVDVKHGTKQIYSRRHEINQWSGENIAISL
jgi:hypothetical protein